MLMVAAFALAGGFAQMVDGTLGMGFGVTSATVLLFMGIAPVTASAATHAAKLPTTFVSGLSHWRVGNVDKAVLLKVGIPGMIGGFLGAVVLTNISLDSAKAWMSGLLIFFGVVIFARFGLGLRLIPTPSTGHTSRWLAPIGLLGGFVDATGGGGWGPVVTPSLFTVTAHEPRKVVGTVNAAEFLVAIAVSTGFLTGIASHGIPWLPSLAWCSAACSSRRSPRGWPGVCRTPQWAPWWGAWSSWRTASSSFPNWVALRCGWICCSSPRRSASQSAPPTVPGSATAQLQGSCCRRQQHV